MIRHETVFDVTKPMLSISINQIGKKGAGVFFLPIKIESTLYIYGRFQDAFLTVAFGYWLTPNACKFGSNDFDQQSRVL